MNFSFPFSIFSSENFISLKHANDFRLLLHVTKEHKSGIKFMVKLSADKAVQIIQIACNENQYDSIGFT